MACPWMVLEHQKYPLNINYYLLKHNKKERKKLGAKDLHEQSTGMYCDGVHSVNNE